MVHFRDLFRRCKKQTAKYEKDSMRMTKDSAEHSEYASSQASHPSIAGMSAAGMQRSNQGTFVTTYIPSTQSQNVARRSSSDISTVSDSSKTAVEKGAIATNEKSTWKGTPNGTAYDRREELTAEDEDMWAKMAM